MPTIVYCYRYVSSTDAVAVVSRHMHTHTLSLSLSLRYLALFPFLCVWYKNPFSHFIGINWNTDFDSSACSHFKGIIDTKWPLQLITSAINITKKIFITDWGDWSFMKFHGILLWFCSVFMNCVNFCFQFQCFWKVDCKILVSFELIWNFIISDLAMAKVEKVNTTVT